MYHLVEEVDRDVDPLSWARRQSNLGKALSALGNRENGTAHLEEAVVAFRAALEEWTRSDWPLLWAETQIDLGLALQALGYREGGTAHLEEAVVAFRAAQEVRTRARAQPLGIGPTQPRRRAHDPGRTKGWHRSP